MKYYLLNFILLIIYVHNAYSLNQIFINQNFIKKVNDKCDNECIQCENSKCLKCQKGFYSLKNKCLKICPENYIADNFSFECKHPIGIYK